MAIEVQEGGGRRSHQVLVLLLLSLSLGCSASASLEPSGNSLILRFHAPPHSQVSVYAGIPDGPGYPRSNGDPFISMSWPPETDRTELLATIETPSHGGMTLSIPWSKERITPRTIQAVAFVDDSLGAPAVATSPAFLVTRVNGELHVVRDVWPGLTAAAPVLGILLILGVTCFACRQLDLLAKISWPLRIALVTVLTIVSMWPRLTADATQSQGRRGDIHPIIPTATDVIPPSESDNVLPLVDIILQHVPRYGSIRIAPCASSGATHHAAANAAWRLWPRHVIWMDENQNLEGVREVGCSLVFRPPPSEFPEGIVLLGSTKSAFVIEALPR